MAKIQEKEAMAHRREEMDDDYDDNKEEMGMMELPPKVVQVSLLVHARKFCSAAAFWDGRRWSSHNIMFELFCFVFFFDKNTQKVYTDIGKLLTHYTSGKLPKAFKVIPSLHNWEEVLYLTRPDPWTPQAMYAATRIFASNLNPKLAQRFYN